VQATSNGPRSPRTFAPPVEDHDVMLIGEAPAAAAGADVLVTAAPDARQRSVRRPSCPRDREPPGQGRLSIRLGLARAVHHER
jgi:hypothetical protein